MELISINVSEEKGTTKIPADHAVVTDTGLEGDAHAGHWHRQVSLLSRELIDAFAAETGRDIAPGEFAENLTTQGLSLEDVCLLDGITVGETVELQVTQIGKECHGNACAIFRETGRCVMPQAGIFSRVVRSGPIAAGDRMTHQPRVLKVHVVTVSDRASRGEYEDRSGPKLRALIEHHLQQSHWRPRITSRIIPDDASRLRDALQAARHNGADAVFTTGGTGIGPRDITPDVIQDIADRTIPGIMEHIRTRYGAEKPAALLSRSVAAVAGNTLIYALPGSVRAVEEYMAEILKTFDHLLFMLNGVDRHGT